MKNLNKILAILFLLGTTSLYASKLSPNSKIEAFDDFSYGLNTNDVPFKMDKRYSQSMSNVFIDEEDGRLMKQRGYVVSGSTQSLSKVNFLFLYKNQDGEKEYIVSDSSVVLTTKDFNLYTLIRGGLNSNQLIQAVQVRDKVWFTNGANSVFTYNGTTVTVLDGQTYSGNPTPNVPKGKYISFFQERVWVYNVSDNDSSVYFTDLVSTNSLLIAPDNYLAWNSENQLNVGQGDGQSGTAMWVYRGNLFNAKERSIYRLTGTDKYSYFYNKTDSKVGVSNQDALTMLDNITYFKSKGEGIYAFDGNNSERISDKIQDNMDSFETNESNIISLKEETLVDFKDGNFYNASTATDSGFVTVVSTYYVTRWVSPTQGILVDKNTTYYASIVSSSNLNENLYIKNGYLTKFYSKIYDHGNDGCDQSGGYIYYGNPTIKFTNKRTGETASASKVGYGVNTYLDGDWILNTNLPVTTDDIIHSSLTYEIFYDTTVCPLAEINPAHQVALHVGGFTEINQSDLYINNLSGEYVSKISTAGTAITSWDSFNSEYTSNGGDVKFYYRTATSAVNITTYPFISITDGAVINSSSTNRFIQYASSFTGISLNDIPFIDYVNMSYNTGGTNDSRVLINNWKNRLWVAGSTSGVNTDIYQKTKVTNPNPNAWTYLNGINFKSILNTVDSLFVGASTWGAVYRLDYGTNFNGSTISAHYETKNIDFDTPFLKKRIQRYYLDVERETGATIRIGTSIDGSNFDYKEIDISGSGRHIYTINDVVGFGKTFKWRFENNQLDKDMRINNFWVIYETTEIE